MVKEIELALENNYGVSVLCCGFNNWSKPNNEKIKKRLLPQIHYYEIPGNRKPILPWLLSSCWFSFSKILLPFFPKNIFLLSLRSNKRSWLLLRMLKSIKEKTDLVVGHNPGSFYPVQLFAKKNNIPFGIDLEDYHPGETNNAIEQKYIKSLLKYVLSKASYITAASPLILEETEKVSGQFSCNPEIVLNYFSAEEFQHPENDDSDKLKLVWFSQNIAKGRGLEEVIPAIRKNEQVALHLYGNPEPDFYKTWIEGIKNIYVHGPLPQADLHKMLRLYDVGLAIEKAASNFNRDLCLTNKILAYFQAGLYIIASNTKAQQKFIEEYPDHGMLTTLESNDLEKEFKKCLVQKNNLRASALERFENAKVFSWETESQKIVQLWKQNLA